MTEKTHSFRTDLNRARGIGSAKDGVGHWSKLRIAAIPMVPLFIYFLTQIDHLTTRNRAAFVEWLQEPVPAIAVILFIVCAFFHGSLGVEEIIIDYVPNEKYKIISLIVNKMFFLGLGFASIYAVLAISFGKI
ncbi:MAG: succinate dehydrogenase, hydrophobic membrane anchor protein [Alphaproteobacteria bacterium]|nr:succinate dehydrogenase, hydrophobic membrane anchor protein [Alphaproteobacteria bacterium]MCK5517912.1 succinate dehydrogenase, hydrophobic membrane anchor protein [Alphaproteobacteria bacterium]MCK5554899.1 succinate dehydrogenase, hydrophobic membrane anchor protein [Alphaproteobacteria bacterium]